MNDKKPDTKFVGKVHKILCDDSVRTGIRSSAIAQDNKRMRIRVLPLQVLFPYPCDVVADKSGCVVTDSQCHIADIPCDIVDAVRDNLTIRERGEVVVKGLERSVGQCLSFTLEVPKHLLLLGINADDGKSYTRSLLANGGDLLELLVPVFHILHGEVLIEGAFPKTKRIKELSDKVAGDVISCCGKFIHNLRDAQGYPYHVLILRQASRMRFYDLHDSLRPLGMLGKCTLPSGTRPADTAVSRTFSGEEFLPSVLKSMCACSHNFTNFAVAEPLSLEVGGLCGQEPSSVSFVQRGHIRKIAWRKDFWRSFRYHFKSIAITLKFTKISPVFLYYTIDSQWFNSNYCHFFGGCYQGGFSTVLNSISWPQMAA